MVLLQQPSIGGPSLINVIEIVFALRMSSILLGPIAPRAAGERGARGPPGRGLIAVFAFCLNLSRILRLLQ
jgi:hypothetical protein